MLQALEARVETSAMWRFRGQTPSPEQWVGALWSNVLAQYLVVTRGSDAPLGLVLAYRPSFQDGHAYLGVLRLLDDEPGAGLMIGTALFIEYVFHCWDFQKLYIETAEYNLQQFEGAVGDLFEVEGRLRNHFSYCGERWDQVVLALYREKWRARFGALVARERPPAQRDAEPVPVSLRFPA